MTIAMFLNKEYNKKKNETVRSRCENEERANRFWLKDKGRKCRM